MSFHKERYFEDLHTFWQYSMQESNARAKSSRSNQHQKWSGGLTWTEAKAMALSGWREGMEQVEKFRASFFPKIASKVMRPLQVYDMVGYQVDVGAFLANQPETFINRQYEERNYPGKVYKLVASISFSAAITPETIIQRGAMICALIDAMEYAGSRVEVICNDAFSYHDDPEYRKGLYKEDGWFEVGVCIKKANQPLEMTDLAFCLAHPAMLRKIMFSCAEIEGWSDFADRYGYPAEATDKGDLYMKEIFSGTVPDEEAIDWVLEQLKLLDIKLEEDI
jgi:hypothetical protein